MSDTAPDNPAIRSHRTVWVLFALAMGTFVLGTTEFASMSLLPYMAADFKVSQPEAGRAISAYALGVVVGSPVITVLSARMPRRALLLGLLLLIGIGNSLSAIAPSLGWMLIFRFLSGVPHGAYFGGAMLMAASLVPKQQRARAMSKVILGLTIATIVGVPFATGIGQTLGWRWGLGIVAILAWVTIVLVKLYAPDPPAKRDASPMSELNALRNRQVWLTLATGAIGFGGIFCTYTYLASTLIDVTHAAAPLIPVMLAVFGVGTTVGNLACGWAADQSPMRSAGCSLLFSAIVLACYPVAAQQFWLLVPLVFLIGCGVGLSAILQTRLMDIADDAQSLAGAMLQSSFNIANAIGPWVGGMVIADGFTVADTGYAASALTLGGLVMWAWSLFDARRAGRQVAA